MFFRFLPCVRGTELSAMFENEVSRVSPLRTWDRGVIVIANLPRNRFSPAYVGQRLVLIGFYAGENVKKFNSIP